ncbi:MAG: UDP-2,3-diacylglucosamine hydrolase [Crocinitomicaceae bacterium]|nr:UDP-2,3-diacylglucosamine hydrolase [Crocinitomicaceae bacterium]
MKRKVDLVVISDVHLGTYGCHAKELLHYLESINPNKVVLNGDIIDGWHFSKRYFPKWHMKVVQHLINWISEQKEVIYITGNHDEILRKFVGFQMNNFRIENKAVLDLGGYKHWFFHGDVFDVTMQHSKWLAKLGGVGYNILILLNSLVNWFSEKIGRGKVSFSKKIKNSVKGAVKHINNFEGTAAEIAATKGYSHVICGHIHQPVKKDITTKEGTVIYLNSGDWIENLTSLEYNEGEWTIFNYLESDLHLDGKISDEVLADLNDYLIFQKLLLEFNLQTK